MLFCQGGSGKSIWSARSTDSNISWGVAKGNLTEAPSKRLSGAP